MGRSATSVVNNTVNWTIGPIATRRLDLEPLHITDSAEMVEVLAEPTLYEFTGGEPPTLDALKSRYARQTEGSGRPGEYWLNWIIRIRVENRPVGFIQATVVDNQAELAWAVGKPWQGAGIASEAARSVANWLTETGSRALTAHIHPQHRASAGVATAVGLHRTGVIDEEGEEVWSSV